MPVHDDTQYQLINTSQLNSQADRKYVSELESIVQRQRTELESKEETIASLRLQAQEYSDQLSALSRQSVFFKPNVFLLNIIILFPHNSFISYKIFI